MRIVRWAQMKASNHGLVWAGTPSENAWAARSRTGCCIRKLCRQRSRSYLAGAQLPRRNARTCFEGPFGEVIRATGPMAKSNPFRFSTKYQDDETDLLYYGYRYYSAITGKWICRDPLQEAGGANLYGFTANKPVSSFDVLGQNIGIDVVFDTLVLAFDLTTGAGYAAVTVDIACLAIPFVPGNPRVGSLIYRVIKGERKAFELLENSEVRSVEFIASVSERGGDISFRPTKASAVLEYRGRLPNRTDNAPYPKHFKYFAGVASEAQAFSRNHASQFMPGLDDAQVRLLIDEALAKYKSQYSATALNSLDGYVYDTAVPFGRSGIRINPVGYADGCETYRIKIHVGTDGSIHAFPTQERQSLGGYNPPNDWGEDK